MAVWMRITHRVPGPIILAATLITVQFDLPVDIIESRFGEIPSHIPAPAFFEMDLGTVRSLLPAAFAIAMLGAIESLLSATVADGMTGSRHNSDVELIAQGIANIALPLFGGIPATGAIARTATNIRNGATSPVAGIAHAATVPERPRPPTQCTRIRRCSASDESTKASMASISSKEGMA